MIKFDVTVEEMGAGVSLHISAAGAATPEEVLVGNKIREKLNEVAVEVLEESGDDGIAVGRSREHPDHLKIIPEDLDIRRGQDAIREIILKFCPTANIDGAGCDSGDWVDFTVEEVRQGLQFQKDEIAKLKQENAELRARGG